LSLAERVVSQSSRGVPGASEVFDGFGRALASADFDRDGYADLAVGQPGEDEGAGAAAVIYGSARGLDTSRSRRLGPTSGGSFGSTLVAGDFNHDRFPDLAIGAPGADAEPIPGQELEASGAVTLIWGGSDGLSAADPLVLRRQGGESPDLGFGSELAAGDLDVDGVTDLIVSSRGYSSRVGSRKYPGSLSYCLGRVGGPTDCPRLRFDQRYEGARALAVSNTSGGSRPEIIVGLPNRNFPDDDPDYALFYVGEVRILQTGSGTRPLTIARDDVLTQNTRGVPGSQEGADRFGSSVAAGDIDRDGYADLVIGAAGEDFEAGRVTVVHGAATGWRTRGNYSFSQDTPGVPGVAEYEGPEGDGDRFGGAVVLLDHDRDGRLDLSIGADGENNDSGAVTTLRGSGRGFTTTGARTFGLATLGYAHPADASFGYSLSKR